MQGSLCTTLTDVRKCIYSPVGVGCVDGLLGTLVLSGISSKSSAALLSTQDIKLCDYAS